MKKQIYVASSWRNTYQPIVVDAIRDRGWDVYDFRNPEPNNHGFHWSEIDPDWKLWSAIKFRNALNHRIADAGYKLDYDALNASDICVLLLPAGRSAHLEAGYCIGQGKPVIVMIPEPVEPELMYKLATRICTNLVGTILAIEDIVNDG